MTWDEVQPPNAGLAESVQALLLRAQSKVGPAAQRSPKIQGFTIQPKQEPILVLEDGDGIYAGDITPSLLSVQRHAGP